MLRKAILVIVLFFPATNILAGAIDFRVGKDMAEISFLTQTSSFGYGGADIGFSAVINEFDDVIGTASILVSGSSAGDLKALHFGVGAKAYLGVLDGPDAAKIDVNGGAIAIGGKIRYVFPSAAPVAILGELFYAPEVTSISDFDELVEFRLAVELEITPSARAYIGYRKLEVTFNDNSDYEFDDEAHVGVRFEF